MKKLFGGLSLVIVLCLCGIAFYSCSNDDKNEPEMTSEKSLLKTNTSEWKVALINPGRFLRMRTGSR